MRPHYEKQFYFAKGKCLSKKSTWSGAFIAVLLVLLVTSLLLVTGQFLEEVNDSSLIFLSSKSCHSVLSTVLAILSGTSTAQFPLLQVCCLS